MIKCPSCSQHEFVGTLFCSECGTRLTQHLPTDSNGSKEGRERADAHASVTAQGLAAGAMVGLKVINTGEVLSLIGRSQFTLGRAVPGQAVVPDVDLDHLEAGMHGVSRLHAELGVGEEQIYLKDLESANGTIVNGKRIPPQRPVSVSNGDLIEIGSLRLQLVSRQT
jgi:pSer/pThr/pTyr-binding forkhead associated (FHA) protein